MQAAACAITAATSGPLSTEKPLVARSLIITGTNPQCTPKITKTCQKAPSSAPPIAGLRVQSQVMASERPLPRALVTGPIVSSVTGTRTATTKNGVRKFRRDEGSALSSSFSRWLCTHTATMIGITDET